MTNGRRGTVQGYVRLHEPVQEVVQFTNEIGKLPRPQIHTLERIRAGLLLDESRQLLTGAASERSPPLMALAASFETRRIIQPSIRRTDIESVVELIGMLAVGNDDAHGAAEPRQVARPRIRRPRTMFRYGTPRVMVALCCSTKLPLRPASEPLTRSIATYPAEPLDVGARAQHLALAGRVQIAAKLLIDGHARELRFRTVALYCDRRFKCTSNVPFAWLVMFNSYRSL